MKRDRILEVADLLDKRGKLTLEQLVTTKFKVQVKHTMQNT